MKKVFTQNDIPLVAAELLLAVSQNIQATVIALSGDLGAGKTTLTQAIARALGVTESLQSPTFVIMKRYETSHDVYGQLIHMDAYRLSGKEELEKLGWNEWVMDPKTLIVIEWPEQVPGLLSVNAHTVSLRHISENEREIELPI